MSDTKSTNGTEEKSEPTTVTPTKDTSSSEASKKQETAPNNKNDKSKASDGEATQEAPQEPPKAEKPLWGRLVSLNTKYKNVELRDDEIVVGRGSQSQVVVDSPNVSGKHCIILRQKTEYPAKGGQERKVDYTVLVKDTSTNGTFVNNDAVGKNNTKLLFDNCEISLLPKKSASEKIAFIFNDCHKENEEKELGGPQGVYELKKELGTGTFASVRLAVHRTTGEEVAIKVIDKQKFLQKAKRKDALMDEVRVLTSVSHPNILQIKGVFETPTTLYLVLELATGGELFDMVVKGAQPEVTACEIFYQILLALKYLHAQGIAHRDLKPENILLQSPDSNVIKISDFGLSRIIDEGTYMRTVCGTPQYVAPEILTKAEKEGYGKAVDMWSLGVILFVLLGGYAPFEDDPKKGITLFEKVKKADYKFDSRYWGNITDEAKDLIRNLLVVDASKRLTAEQSLNHPWIALYRDKFLPPDNSLDKPTDSSVANDSSSSSVANESTDSTDSSSSTSSDNSSTTTTTTTETTEDKKVQDIIYSPLPISARRRKRDTKDNEDSSAKKRKVTNGKEETKKSKEDTKKGTTKAKKATPAKKAKATPKRR